MAATLSELLDQREADGSINRYDALSNGNFDEGSEELEDSFPASDISRLPSPVFPDGRGRKRSL
jgi:hypothetical protein